MQASKRNEFIALVQAKLKEAEAKYDIDFGFVDIRLDIRGRCAGQAIKRFGQYTLRFNPEAIANHWDEMSTDTIPHEVAHLVCYARPALGKNHDRGWKRVCRELGGDDARTHDMQLTPGRKTTTYTYRATCGKEVEVGAVRHRKIQERGARYTLRNGGKITRECYVGSNVTAPAPVSKSKQPKAPQRDTGAPSKAQMVREYIDGLHGQGISYADMLDNVPMHVDALLSIIEYGARGAARSAFIDNVKKKMIS